MLSAVSVRCAWFCLGALRCIFSAENKKKQTTKTKDGRKNDDMYIIVWHATCVGVSIRLDSFYGTISGVSVVSLKCRHFRNCWESRALR